MYWFRFVSQELVERDKRTNTSLDAECDELVKLLLVVTAIEVLSRNKMKLAAWIIMVPVALGIVVLFTSHTNSYLGQQPSTRKRARKN